MLKATIYHVSFNEASPEESLGRTQHPASSDHVTANVSFEAYDHDTHEFVNARLIVKCCPGASQSELGELVLERLKELSLNIEE